MKEVLLLGSDDSAYDCPFHAELWTTTTMLPNIDPDCTKVFDDGCNEGLSIALEKGIPVISKDNLPCEEFGINYFRSPLSYLLAYAIHLGYEKIGIYGFDLKTEDEYEIGRPRITFWLGVAKGKGIVVEIAPNSRLYRVFKDNVRDRWKRAMALKDGVTPEDYLVAIQRGVDPYCFVCGIDKDAVTITNYGENERVITSWHPAT